MGSSVGRLRLRKAECIVQACICDKRHRLHLKTTRSVTSAHVMDQSALNSEAYQHLVLKKKLRLQGWGLGLVGIGPSRLGQESPSLCPHAPQLKKVLS